MYSTCKAEKPDAYKEKKIDSVMKIAMNYKKKNGKINRTHVTNTENKDKQKLHNNIH